MSYIPVRGDVVWLQFDPQAGHEQGGRRPALVLSPQSYNGKVGLMLCCPITSRRKGYPFEVLLPEDSTVKGVILCDQLKSLDWRWYAANAARPTTRHKHMTSYWICSQVPKSPADLKPPKFTTQAGRHNLALSRGIGSP